MDNLYIQIEDTLPVNHPAYESNLIEAFGEVPPNWVPFVRVDGPVLGVYRKFDTSQGHEGCGCEYVATSDGFTDVWHILSMTSDERLEAKAASKPRFITTWAFDEPTCTWNAPTDPPSDESLYIWRDSDLTWVELVGTRPSDGDYYFNVNSESWVLIPTRPSDAALFNDQTGEWVSE